MVRTQECDDLDKEIELLQKDGYRLDMIMPADSPRVVQLSKNDEIIRLVLRREPVQTSPEGGTQNGWIKGRAGMMYRDLIPDRAGGKLIASHICLTAGGPVPDYVHYHKVDFQLIYCLKGRIRVVYEDQGPPFWLKPGDCVLQPPKIRHRVLECEAGSEVLEISSPAEHETWVEHQLSLPTLEVDSQRSFKGQRFVRHIAAESTGVPRGNGAVCRQTGIFEATNALASVAVLTLPANDGIDIRVGEKTVCLIYLISGTLVESTTVPVLRSGKAKLFTGKRDLLLSSAEKSEFLHISLDLP